MTRPAVKPLFGRTGQETADRNFAEVSKIFGESCPVIMGVTTETLTLVNGVNTIKLPGRVKNPIGRITVYQNIAATITDLGPDGNGNWQVNCSAGCAVRFLFY